MANIFKVTRKKRDDELEKATSEQPKPSGESQPSDKTMSYSQFFYGPEGMKRKPKGTPPASMNP